MRKNWLLVGIALLMAVLAIAAVACDDEEEEGDETPAPGDETPGAEIGTVDVLGIWGEEEQDDFNAMVQPWKDDTGGDVDFTGTRDINSLLRTRVEGGNPPDVAIPAALGIFQDLAREGQLMPLSSCPGLEEKVNTEYPQSFVDLGTVDGTLYGVFMKAGNKATIWYSPPNFEANGYEVPTTWDEVIELSDQMVADGNTPWSDAEAANGGSGFPGSDWVQQIVLNQHGPDVYDQWVAHEIPYNDDRIKESWQMFGDILLNEDYVLGGTDRAIATTFSEGSIPLFADPPEAFMHYLGSFNSGFITDPTLGFPEGLVAGEDFDFFAFPTINEEFAGGVTGDANIMMLFNNDETTCSFAEWMASADAQEIWVGRGGFTSVNTMLSLDAYPSDLDRAVAEQLTDPDVIFRFDADDAMPSGVGGDNGAVFTGVLDYLSGEDLDSVLQGIEDTFPEEGADETPTE